MGALDTEAVVFTGEDSLLAGAAGGHLLVPPVWTIGKAVTDRVMRDTEVRHVWTGDMAGLAAVATGGLIRSVNTVHLSITHSGQRNTALAILALE